ncbi:MAG: DegT/DnrJ/EryC1/StrS family aminotransferase [Candidatus Paceibacterota bacterium]|jgi:dTDP-4-amino-4,6-dideoxygalactose transaminase
MFKRFQPIAAALAPNYTFRDVLIAMKYVYLPWKWGSLKRGNNQDKLELAFKEFMDARYAISFDSARSGFFAILKCLGIGENDEVLLQAFTTVALPNAIMWCKATPIFVDIDEKTFNMDPGLIEKHITSKTKAIVVQHTFGNPSDMDRILSIARKHNLLIIEDCAHSLGAEYRGKKTGTFGNAAFFSFGRDKVISAVSGGIVITADWNLGRSITDFRNKLPYPSDKHIFRQLLHPMITTKSLKLYNFFGIGKFMMYAMAKSGILTKAYDINEKKNIMPHGFPAKMPNALCEIALHQLKLADEFNDHRAKIASLYTHRLKDEGELSLPETTHGAKNIFLWYTILTENKKQTIANAKLSNIFLGDWFPAPVGPIEVDLERSGYRPGSCPIAEKVSSKCVNLPTNKNTSKDDAIKVINSLIQ